MYKEGIVVLTHSVGCYCYIRTRVSYDLQLRRGIAVPRFVVNNGSWGTGGQKKISNMKSLFSITMLRMLSMTVYAQQNVTRFLGIPVDGSKSEMIRKLKAKGYQSSPISDVLVGEFNGVNVNIVVVTNNNKVWRIMVADANSSDELNIRIRFNELCKQFANNSKYMSSDEDYTIPEDENISYKMIVDKKRYEAVFYQKPVAMDTVGIVKIFRTTLLSKYTDEQLENPTEELQSEIIKISESMIVDYLKRPVWFMISNDYGKYRINMYYDNEYNHANGEDL